MMSKRSEKYLAVYSGVLTLVFAVTVLTGAADTSSRQFDVIDVQRINIREADGTLRMVVSGRDTFPGGIIRGKEYPHPRGVAGMIFYNDEGSETGGLTFAGTGADGEVERSSVHLSFDPYERDQTVQLTEIDAGEVETAALVFRDKSQLSIPLIFEEMERIRALPEERQEQALRELVPEGTVGATRLVVGKTEDQRALVDLKDAGGNSRLRLAVTPEGGASIEFLDASGEVVRTITADDASRH